MLRSAKASLFSVVYLAMTQLALSQPPVPLISDVSNEINSPSEPILPEDPRHAVTFNNQQLFQNFALYKQRDVTGNQRPAVSVGAYRTRSVSPTVHPDHVLPGPADANQMHANDAAGTTGTQTILTSSALAVSYGFQVKPGVYYDTRFAGTSVFSPASIPVGPSHQNGALTFNPGNPSTLGTVPFVGDLGAHLLNIDNIGTFQVHSTVVGYSSDQVTARNAYMRWVDPNEKQGLLFGKTETLFGDLGSAPTTLVVGSLPIGAVAVGGAGYTGVTQFRYSKYVHGIINELDVFEAGVSVEDQSLLGSAGSNDIYLSDPKTSGVIHRYPSLVGRLRYAGPNHFDSYQIAALAREMTFNDSQFSNHYATGWGVSANARFALGELLDSDAVYLGGVVGQGIGGYIYNGTDSAVASSINVPQFQLYNNYGAYVAYRKVWRSLYKSQTEYWSSKFMIGHVAGDVNVTATSPAVSTETRACNQLGFKLLFHAGDSATAGLEYQYGTRSLVSAAHGDDHRIMFVISASTGVDQKASASTSVSGSAAKRFSRPAASFQNRLSALRL